MVVDLVTGITFMAVVWVFMAVVGTIVDIRKDKRKEG